MNKILSPLLLKLKKSSLLLTAAFIYIAAILPAAAYLLPASSANAASAPVPIYRFYNTQKGVHFFTNSEAERDYVSRTLGSLYTYEGIAGYSLSQQEPDSTPVYRFYNFKQGVHFYTNSYQEYLNVRNTLAYTYTYEGIAYYSYPTALNTTSAVYRFYSASKGAHFYTNSFDEYRYVLTTLRNIYTYEGIAYYLPQAAVTPPQSAAATISFSSDGCYATFNGAPGMTIVDGTTSTSNGQAYDDKLNFTLPQTGTQTQSAMFRTSGDTHYAKILNGTTVVVEKQVTVSAQNCRVDFADLNSQGRTVSYSANGCYATTVWKAGDTVIGGVTDGLSGAAGGTEKTTDGTSTESIGFVAGSNRFDYIINAQGFVVAANDRVVDTDCGIDRETSITFSADGCYAYITGPVSTPVMIGTHNDDSGDSSFYFIDEYGTLSSPTMSSDFSAPLNYRMIPQGDYHFVDILDANGNSVMYKEARVTVANCSIRNDV